MTDRPAGSSVEQVAGLVGATATVLRAELLPLENSALTWHPSEGEWCICEVLGHMIEAERRGFAGRIERILAGEKLQDWNQGEVAAQRRDCERDGHDLLEEFDAIRRASVRLIGRLTPEQLPLSGSHPTVGELRIVELLHEWVHHDRNHVKQVLTTMQALVWPHMGNAQRFWLASRGGDQ